MTEGQHAKLQPKDEQMKGRTILYSFDIGNVLLFIVYNKIKMHGTFSL